MTLSRLTPSARTLAAGHQRATLARRPDRRFEAAPHIEGYRIRRRIGGGRTATVYLANDLLRGGELVLKVPHRRDEGSAARKESFAQEFTIPSLIRSAHVIRVFEQLIGDEYSYIAMDYLKGGDLTARIRSGLAASQALVLLRQAALALEELHRRGFVHCDVKPANLLLHARADLVLADFGSARQAGAISLAAPGAVLGTPCYAAPEQTQGDPARPAADVYSLGVVFYEMLCGKPPFTGVSAMEVSCQHLMAPVPRLPAELAAFQPLIDSMLQKQPRSRLPDGAAVLHRIDLIKAVPCAGAGAARATESRCLPWA
jgi:serine/threonine protein kinase